MTAPWKDKREGPGWTMYLGDCREIVPALGRFDAVVTDPPYPKEFLPVLAQCWEECAKTCPLAFVMSGQMWLPTVMSGLASSGWHYRWCGSFSVPHMNGCIWPIGVSTGWKPMLIYASDKSHRFKPWKYDIITPQSKATDDKVLHKWGQDVAQFHTLITRFDVEGDILDPFAGSGTTGVACIETGRRFVGIEIDPRYFEVACNRLRSATPCLFTEAAR